MTNFVFNDGGRKDAGFKGQTGDCVTRSIAIATQKPYQEVYDAMNALSKDQKLGYRKEKSKYGTKYVKVSAARTGVVKKVYDKYLKDLGFTWKATMGIGTGCRVHLKADELPSGRIIASLSAHLVAVVDGVINDTYDCSRGGKRCVYGYYYKES
jgi:hypothetical protein